MSATTPAVALNEIDLDWIQRASKAANEPAWLAALRARAFANFAALPWPGPRDEAWKRAELELLAPAKLIVRPTGAEALPPLQRDRLAGRSLLRSSQENGDRGLTIWSDLKAGFTVEGAGRAAGVDVLPLATAIERKRAEMEKAWTAAVERAKANKFASLTLALGNGGAAVFVEKSGPALPLQFVTAGAESGAAFFPLQFLFLGEGAEVRLWEEFLGESDALPGIAFVSSFTHVELGANAHAAMHRLQQWPENVVHFRFQEIAQGAASRLNTVDLATGARVFRNESAIELSGRGAENKVLGVLFGNKEQNFENWITQRHTARETTSDIQYRGALDGASKSFFSGMVAITKEAQKSDAYQSMKTLLLSNEAKADAIPNLEILADDVKCSHGAAVGPVDQDQKFYLQARGIPPKEAEEIIIQGFLEPVLAEVPSEVVRERLRAFLDRKLGQA